MVSWSDARKKTTDDRALRRKASSFSGAGAAAFTKAAILARGDGSFLQVPCEMSSTESVSFLSWTVWSAGASDSLSNNPAAGVNSKNASSASEHTMQDAGGGVSSSISSFGRQA